MMITHATSILAIMRLLSTFLVHSIKNWYAGYYIANANASASAMQLHIWSNNHLKKHTMKILLLADRWKVSISFQQSPTISNKSVIWTFNEII